MIEKVKVASTFKAKPLSDNVIHGDPIEPLRSVRPLTVPEDVRLRSEARAEDRRNFNDEAAQARHQIESVKAMREAEERLAEEARMKKLRRTSIEEGGFDFIARSIMEEDPHPLQAGPPPTPLTDPHSPFLLTKQRANLAQQSAK